MKLKSALLAFLLFSLQAESHAQDTAIAQPMKQGTDTSASPFAAEAVHAGSIILFVYLLTLFVLTLVRSILDYQLKRKIIEKGTAEPFALKILEASKTDTKSEALKYVLLLASLGVGLFVVKMTGPIGVHSAMILCFSLAIGFLLYFLSKRKMEDR